MSSAARYEVSGWIYKPDAACLVRPGESRTLTPQINRLLLALIEADEQTLSKDALVDAGWNRTIVTDDAIARAISELRKALRAEGEPDPIRTLHGFGYKLATPVSKTRGASIYIVATAAALALIAVITAIQFSADSGPQLESQATTPMSVFNDLDPGNRYLPLAQRLIYVEPSSHGDSLIAKSDQTTAVLVRERDIGAPEASPDGLRVAFFDFTEGCELRVAELGSGSVEPMGSCIEHSSRALAWAPGGALLFAQLSEARLTLYEFSDGDTEISTILAPECASLKDVGRRPDGRTYLSCATERGDALFEWLGDRLSERLRYRSIEKISVGPGEEFYLLHAPRWKAGVTRFTPPDRFVFMHTGWALDLALAGQQLTLVRDLTNPDLLAFEPATGRQAVVEEGPVHTQAFTLDAQGVIWTIDDREGQLAVFSNGKLAGQFEAANLAVPFSEVTCMRVAADMETIHFYADRGVGSQRASHDLESGALLNVDRIEGADPCTDPTGLESLPDARASGHDVRQVQSDPTGSTIYYLIDRTAYVDIAVWDVATSD